MNPANPLLRRILWGSPSPVRDVIATLYGAWHRRRVTAGDYREHYAFLERSQRITEEELRRWQERRVIEFVRAAALRVPYYRRLFERIRLDPDRITRIEDLRRLPLLEKETVRERMNELVADSFAKARWGTVRTHTSGTTGKGLEVVLSLSVWRREYAFRDLHLSWGGIRPGMRAAWIAGHPVTAPDRLRPPFWVQDHANHAIYFSSQHLGPPTLPYYLKQLGQYRPAMLRGYPSSLYTVALAALDERPVRLQPRAVFTNSETLLDLQRQAIESAFGCNVFNWYGNAECVGNVVECERGSLHVKLEHSLLEILRSDGAPARPGESAELICTGFGNDAMPLIRYRIGDLAVPSDRSCSCGRPGPLFERIEGRVEDVVVTPDGRRLGRLDHLFKDTRRVREAQIVQEVPEALRILIVAAPGFDETDRRSIEVAARVRIGSEVRLHFEFVEAIPRGPAGKFRFVTSRVGFRETTGGVG